MRLKLPYNSQGFRNFLLEVRRRKLTGVRPGPEPLRHPCMTDCTSLLFIHGLAGSGQGFKATYLRGIYPDLLAPDFPGEFWERMAQLESLISETGGWTLIGSSMGGLMAAVFACQHPGQVERLVLLVPALPYIDLAQNPLPPIDIPVTIVHGAQDDIVPIDQTRSVAGQIFTRLTFMTFDATHDLNPIVPQLDWPALLRVPFSGPLSSQP